MINKILLEKYIKLMEGHHIKKYYIPIDNIEYRIRLSGKDYKNYLSIAHCDFNLVNKDIALYFPSNICETNLIFYNKYIKTGIYLLEEICFDDIFDGYSFTKDHMNYYKTLYHISKESINLFFDNLIINGNSLII